MGRLVQWDDERVPRAHGLALFDALASAEKTFDALASAEKTLHANPGRHADPLTFQLDFATGDASAARQQIIINRRLVSGQVPGTAHACDLSRLRP
jgi:hypothetical protein